MLEKETTTKPNLVEAIEVSRPVELVELEYQVAMPYRQYCMARLVRLVGDSQIAFLLAVFLFALSKDFVSGGELILVPFFCFFFVAIKILRGLNVFEGEWYGLLSTDSKGAKLTFIDAFWRALVLLFTLPLLPINFIFMAVGSRRLLHDYLSGTALRPADEDPATTFYPPVPGWWAPMLILSCALLACFSAQCQSYLCEIEALVAPKLLGEKTKAYYRYLCFRDGNREVPVSVEKANSLLARSEDRCRLALDCYGEENIETISNYLYAAQLAAVAHDEVVCLYWIRRLQSLDQALVSEALAADRLGSEYHVNSPRDEYSCIVDLLSGVLRTDTHHPSRSYAPVKLSNFRSAIRIKREVFGAGSKEASFALLSAAFEASKAGKMSESKQFTAEFEKTSLPVLQSMAAERATLAPPFSRSKEDYILHIYLNRGMLGAAEALAERQCRAAILADNPELAADAYWNFVETLKQNGFESNADRQGELVLAYLKKKNSELVGRGESKRAKEVERLFGPVNDRISTKRLYTTSTKDVPPRE